MKIVDFVTLFLLCVWFFLALYAVLSPKNNGNCRCNLFIRRDCSEQMHKKRNDNAAPHPRNG